uniref:CCR4-Not complex component Not N-terminal domain-containing protein n=1 Tax=Octactis speculum TaxID=3111310 RepID=A0A7S2AHM1_9STRA|mmetsp:Transcript_10090/g.13188  ORF Transcript_10090/g.13188 Transcript_10090/m.13188 type:complete len:293 (+) Transcript_10090:76-954(+)
MSGARKLQTEIDRTLKKVEEGVELFDETWEKVYSATQQNQKEKYEVDLKKEIKKLQRLRDQIKTWISSNDTKDKRQLMDARKLIETKMEQFKVCEKETKTKTYSKEGLAREARLDPAEQQKQDCHSYLQDCIARLEVQIEATEADVEKLSSGKGKNKNKAELEEKDTTIRKHRWHISKMEQIIRMLDNDVLEVERIEEVKEDIEYYIDSNQDPEFMASYEDMDPYEVLELEEIPAPVVELLPTVKSSRNKKNSGDDDEKDEKKKKKDKKDKKALSSAIPITIGRAKVCFLYL